MTTTHKPRARKDPNESALVTAILKALKMKGVWAWRVNSGLTVFKAQAGHARRVVKGAEPGTPDILLVYERPISTAMITGERVTVAAAGCMAGIEVKTATGKLSPSQLAWHTKAERHGVRVGVARSISDALALVQLWSGKGATCA